MGSGLRLVPQTKQRVCGEVRNHLKYRRPDLRSMTGRLTQNLAMGKLGVVSFVALTASRRRSRPSRPSSWKSPLVAGPDG